MNRKKGRSEDQREVFEILSLPNLTFFPSLFLFVSLFSLALSPRGRGALDELAAAFEGRLDLAPEARDPLLAGAFR